MSLFGSKKKEVQKVTEKTVAVKIPERTLTGDVIIRPRITEKSGIAQESRNIYTFEVTQDATKASIAKALREIYKVTPIKIRTISLPAKSVFVRGRWGTKTGTKKALVYLKKGDKIEIA